MELLLTFTFGVVVLSVWEWRGGPRWRSSLAILACAVVGAAYLSQRVL